MILFFFLLFRFFSVFFLFFACLSCIFFSFVSFIWFYLVSVCLIFLCSFDLLLIFLFVTYWNDFNFSNCFESNQFLFNNYLFLFTKIPYFNQTRLNYKSIRKPVKQYTFFFYLMDPWERAYFMLDVIFFHLIQLIAVFSILLWTKWASFAFQLLISFF